MDEELWQKNRYTSKLEKTLNELDTLGINYPANEPIPEELKNAL